jgi:hypothetical protein
MEGPGVVGQGAPLGEGMLLSFRPWKEMTNGQASLMGSMAVCDLRTTWCM